MYRLLVMAIVSMVVGVSTAGAQAWPDRPIKFLMSAPAGSSIDVLGRAIADKLKDRLGQPVVVENKPAAGGTVATAEVAHSAPDGYTMVLAFNGPLSFAPLLQKLPYDVGKDLAPVIITSSQPNVLAVNATLPVRSIAELVAYAKANPGKLNYGSAGNGTTHHLAGELFKTMTGVDLTHIPYKGAGPMMQDLLAGQVDMAFDGMSTSAPQIKAGKLKALAVTTAQRSFVDPSVPTMQEAGVTGYIVTTWYALWAPKGTPKDAIDRMYQETVKAMRSPELKNVWEAQGATAGGESPAEFEKLIHSEIAKWAKVVKDAGAKIDN